MDNKPIEILLVEDNAKDRELALYSLKENNLAGIVTEHDIFKALMNNKDLLSAVVDNSGNLSIPPKNINEELTHFWFNNAFFKQ